MSEAAQRRARLRARFSAGKADSTPQEPDFLGGDVGEAPPLSSSQLRAWYLDQFEGSSKARTFWGAYRLKGDLHLPSFEKALSEVMGRHDALRSFVQEKDGTPVLADSGITMPGWEAYLLPPDMANESQEDLLDGFLKTFFRGELSLSQAPLIRCGLFQISAQEHVFCLEVHHAVFDGWSLGIFLKDLGSAYDGARAGQITWTGEVPVSFGQYAAWQRTFAESETVREQMEWWLHHLRKPLAVLELPTDRPRPAEQAFHGEALEYLLDEELFQEVTRIGREVGATPFMVLLTGFFTLLNRYTGQDDIVVGTPMAGRNHRGVSETIGFFANTLALRAGFHEGLSFREQLQGVRDTCLSAYEYQDVPFEKLVEEINPDRDLSRTPLYQCMLGYEERSGVEPPFQDLVLEDQPVPLAAAQLDMSWWVARTEKGVLIRADFLSTLFDTDTVRRMFRSYESILKAACRNPGIPVGELPLFQETDQAELSSRHGVEKEMEEAGELVDWLMRDWPSKVHQAAVVGTDYSLTYGELASRSSALARELETSGVQPGDLVGIYLERSPAMVVAALAIWKVGAAYVPLDPDHPESRLSHIAQGAGLKLLITDEEAVDETASYAPKAVIVDARSPGDDSPHRQGPNDVPNDAPYSTRVNPEGLAYATFTSGSTGKPKGVEVPQTAVQNFLASMSREPGFGPHDRLLAITTLAFDISVLELFLPLSVGGTVVVADADTLLDGSTLQEFMEEQDISVMQATPATWRMLLDAGWKGNAGLKVLVGGEAFPPSLAEELGSRCQEVWNMYGPTETTVWSTVARVSQTDGSIPIGHPIENTQIFVLDANEKPVPMGVPGELYIGGTGVTRGYRNRPDLTEERFRPDPFTQGDTGRIYRTGDLARFRNDGDLEYLGRMDNQIKIRGFRIEPGEVESHLTQHDQIRKVVVKVHGSGPDARLVAYIVFEAGGGMTNTEVRRFLRKKVPPYMIPNLVMEIDELPLTPNGKVDRKALPDPSGTTPRTGTRHVPPETPEEVILSEIWQELLNVSTVGRNDNFFDLGGHSLLSMQVVSIVEGKTGIRLNPRAMFFKTLGQLASDISLDEGIGR